MDKKLSTKTKNVLNVLINWIKQYNYSPTIYELADKCRLKSTWTVRYHLNKLSEAGYVRLKKGIARGIELLNKATGIPLVGRVPAGNPIDAIENTEEYIELSNFFKEDIFAVKIKGDSMKDSGIFDGDIVFVRKQPVAENGDIVVALIDNEVTVKKFYLTKSSIKLLSANPKYKPIISKDIQILGKIIGVFRKL